MLKISSDKSKNKTSGFTIIELLIVVVVIGILSAIVLVSYNGVTARAIDSSLRADLSGASTQLKVYQVENGSFPTTNDCNGGPRPAPPAICLRPSTGNNFLYSVNDLVQPRTFTLIVINGNNKYSITDSSAPYRITSDIADGGVITISGQYIIHTFKSSGALVLTSGTVTGAEALVVGGGGGGGAAAAGYSGGGGAGRFLAANNLSFSGSTPVTVGSGGSAGNNGGSSVLGASSSAGGGAGGTGSVAAKSGASGGGGSIGLVGGAATAGFIGGPGGSGGLCGGQPGGGGGAAGSGGVGGSCIGGGGGAALSSSITGTQVWYAGGGAAENGISDPTGGGGGSWGNPGVPNSGGGGFANTSGGSGVVIVRYLLN